ncbi:hypothetical protein BJ166DRAFT_382464 [Pestalotiopsis sp. NC0098]|nr:hypothetical protein BJ166DRAFT_382464 [Pestalotiopsis sp. NC0098]
MPQTQLCWLTCMLLAAARLASACFRWLELWTRGLEKQGIESSQDNSEEKEDARLRIDLSTMDIYDQGLARLLDHVGSSP